MRICPTNIIEGFIDMIKTIVVHDIGELQKYAFPEELFDFERRKIESVLIFRGEPFLTDPLKTSFTRLYGDRYRIEERMLINFHKYGQFVENDLSSSSIWEQLIYAQHHGVPTRLLDWTFSPLVALHFAIGDYHDNGEDSVVWGLDVKNATSLLPESYTKVLAESGGTFFTLELLKKVAYGFADYDKDMNKKSFVIMEPPSVDERIINQYSLFTVMPRGMESMEPLLTSSEKSLGYKYIIPSGLKWELRCILDRMNVNERVLFPGLDGLAHWLKRYYLFY